MSEGDLQCDVKTNERAKIQCCRRCPDCSQSSFRSGYTPVLFPFGNNRLNTRKMKTSTDCDMSGKLSGHHGNSTIPCIDPLRLRKSDVREQT